MKLKIIILFQFSVAAEEDEVEDETVVEDEEVAEGKLIASKQLHICLQYYAHGSTFWLEKFLF